MNDRTILKAAEHYVAQWYLEHPMPQLAFHNMALSQRLVKRIQELGHGQNMPESVVVNAQVAALFSQIGFGLNYEQPVEASGRQLQEFLATTSLKLDEKSLILDCLINGQESPSEASELYMDAWASHVLGDGLSTYLPLYRLELQLVRQEAVGKSVSRAWFYSQIKKTKLHSNFAKAKYQTILAENQANLERQVSKKVAKDGETTRLFGGISRQPSREIQTFFRTSFEYHTKLIGITDNKARIMISVNSILVSILISLLTYKYRQVATSMNPMVIVPILIFLIAAVGSLIFAILSSRPNLPSNSAQPHEQLFSFMDFVKLKKSDYQKQLDVMLRDGSAIFASMSAALYSLGEILDRKYKYLTISYNVFMVGFVVTVVMFVITYFF